MRRVSTFSRSNEPTNEPSSLSFRQRRRRLIRDQHGDQRPRARRITLARVVRPRWAVGIGHFSFCFRQLRRPIAEPRVKLAPGIAFLTTTGIKTAARLEQNGGQPTDVDGGKKTRGAASCRF